MTTGNFDACLGAVLRWEGGFADNPKDPGGATNMGITRQTLAEWRHVPLSSIPVAAVKALTREEAGAIYAARYWTPVAGDQLPAGCDLAVFDYAVNSGVGRASKAAQKVAGVKQDGRIGPQSLTAIKYLNPGGFIRGLCSERLGFLRALAIWNTFGKGWSRRVAGIEAAALAMVLTPTQMKREADASTKAAVGQAAGGAVAAGGGTAGTADPAGQVTGLDLGALPGWAWAALALAIAVPLAIHVAINLQRAAAIRAAAPPEA